MIKLKHFLIDNNIENTVSVGSSLKFCIVATGDADIYPRFWPDNGMGILPLGMRF